MSRPFLDLKSLELDSVRLTVFRNMVFLFAGKLLHIYDGANRNRFILQSWITLALTTLPTSFKIRPNVRHASLPRRLATFLNPAA